VPACPNCGRENPEGFRFCGFCKASIAGEESEVRKTVTVLFADVTGSTALGERLDPESLRRVMTRYFDVARTVLERHGGTVEKFIGDAVMAVFGVPLVHEDDALRATRAAVEMREALVELNTELEQKWGASLQIRTALNSGSVVAGDPSAGQSFVSGDTVNVAARLEQAADPGEILIGAETVRLVRDAVRVERIDALSLKGKAAPVPAFRLVEVIPGARAFARRLDSHMVGRDNELHRLVAVFEQSLQGPGCELVTVFGVAGVGKSRLVSELSASLAARALFLEGRCLPYGDGITFWPVAEIVKEAAGIESADAPEQGIAKIGSLLAGVEPQEGALIRDRVGAAIGLQEAGGAIQETFWAVRRLLESLADERPVVALIDDIHWAEPTLLDLIHYIAAFSRGHPLLLVCTARPELREARPDWGATGTTLSLHPLGPADSGLLIDTLLRRAQLPEKVLERVVHSAEGNPLFLEEMLRMLIDDGVLRPQNGHWVATSELTELSTPSTIQGLLAARLDRLQDKERAVIQRASVVGRVFYWGAVAELSSVEQRGSVGEQLQTLLRKELILPEPSPFAGEDAFRFSHALVREAAYESTPKRLRADLHEQFASWLIRTSGPRMSEFEEIIGYHLEQTHRYLSELGPIGDRGKSVASSAGTHLASAGHRAFARGDIRAAANMLTRAASLLTGGEPAHLDVLAELGAVLSETGEWPEAEVVLSNALDEARHLHDKRTEALAQVRLTYLRLHTLGFSYNTDALPELERCIAIFEEIGDDGGIAEGSTMVAFLHFWNGRAGIAVDAAESAVEHARLADDHRRETEALVARSLAESEGPMHTDRVASSFEGLLRGAAATDRVLRSGVTALRAEIEAMRGNFDLARTFAAEARTLTEELGLEISYANRALRCEGRIATLAGELGAAEAALGEAVAILRKLGDFGHLSSLAPLLADVLYAQGRNEDALALTEEARDITLQGDLDAEVNWRRVHSKALARHGQMEEAVRLATEAVDLARPSDNLNLRGMSCADLAEVLHLAERDADAATAFREATEMFGLKGNMVMAKRMAARLDELAAGS
jgi:class 3 adenylate cyclase